MSKLASAEESRKRVYELEAQVADLSRTCEVEKEAEIRTLRAERDALADHLTELEQLAGNPARLDLIQLGLGDDGHTASLFPNDPALEATTDLAVSAEYKGPRRWTMTAPLINRAHERLFLVTGTEKDEALGLLAAGDPGIPGSLITEDQTFLATDRQITGFSPKPW